MHFFDCWVGLKTFVFFSFCQKYLGNLGKEVHRDFLSKFLLKKNIFCVRFFQLNQSHSLSPKLREIKLCFFLIYTFSSWFFIHLRHIFEMQRLRLFTWNQKIAAVCSLAMSGINLRLITEPALATNIFTWTKSAVRSFFPFMVKKTSKKR